MDCGGSPGTGLAVGGRERLGWWFWFWCCCGGDDGRGTVEAISSWYVSTNSAVGVAVRVAVAATGAAKRSVSVVNVLVEAEAVVVLIRSYKEARPLNVGLGVNPMLCIRVRYSKCCD